MDKCPYHDELVNELKVVESSVSTIEKTLVTLDNTCKHLDETTIKSKEFYEEMLKHYEKEGDIDNKVTKKSIMIYCLLVAIGGLIGFSIPQFI